MDEKQTGKMDKNRHFHKYYQQYQPYLPRKYFPYCDPHRTPNIETGFWNGLVHFLSYLNVILRSIILLKRGRYSPTIQFNRKREDIFPYLHSGQNLEW